MSNAEIDDREDIAGLMADSGNASSGMWLGDGMGAPFWFGYPFAIAQRRRL